jgi:hypothetical protein
MMRHVKEVIRLEGGNEYAEGRGGFRVRGRVEGKEGILGRNWRGPNGEGGEAWDLNEEGGEDWQDI